MKKYALMLGSVLAISVVNLAFAEELSVDDNKSYLGSLEPGQTKTKTFNLVEGNNEIVVRSSDDDALFTCLFHNDNGFTGLEQVKVPNCSGKLELKTPMTLELEITNETGKSLDYEINLRHSEVVAPKKGKKK